MSSQSVRRIKERGLSAEKIAPLISEKPSIGRKSIGKENPNLNPRLVSKVNGPAQKPVIRPMPRVSDVIDVRSRCRSQSQPRGRSSSPSDFTRVLSDIRKNRVSGGGNFGRTDYSNGKGLGGIRVLERKIGDRNGVGTRVLSKVDGNGVNEMKFSSDGLSLSSKCRNVDALCLNSTKMNSGDGKCRNVDALCLNSTKMNSGDGKCRNVDALCLNSTKMNLGEDKGRSFSVLDDGRAHVGKALGQSIVLNGRGKCDSEGMNSGGKCERGDTLYEKSSGNVSDGKVEKGVSFVDVGSKGCNGKVLDQGNVVKGSSGVRSERMGLELSGKGSGVKIASNGKGFDVGKEKVVNEEGSSGRAASKSASRLHEKLAYLEGKVKRIAGDIKKTKEMLDMNNTDASKVILSDIQQKISGIEKAVGNVMADSNSHVIAVSSGVSSKLNGEKLELAESANVSVKGLSCQELEARLFPHQKFLRSRSLSKESAPGIQVDGNNVLVVNNVSNSGQNSADPIEDNPIAQQFLASLTKVQAEVINTTHGDMSLIDEVKDTEEPQTSTAQESSGTLGGLQNDELDLEAHEKLEEFDDQDKKPDMVVEEEREEDSVQLAEIGRKTSTGGWFVNEGESILLAHDDGSCSFHDIVNNEEKAEYIPPPGISHNIWRDCWIIRAPGADGCSAKYVVAASAGNTMDSGFCSWDFYNKDVRAFHNEDNTSTTRVALSPLPDNVMHRRDPLSGLMYNENRQWWYRPCGPLIISTASSQRAVKVFDIRDGEQIMKWDVQKPILAMEYCSPLQWRNRGKVVLAEAEGISLWDVSSMNPQALLSVSTSGHRISALHVNNTDAELGGGVRQRISSSEAEGNDGVFCTADSINILDFRQPSGIGLRIPKAGVNVQSVSSRGDSIFLGCNNVISSAKKQVNSQVLQFSLRKQKIVSTYNLPESTAHSHHKALTQVWGNSDLVMAVSGLGLFVFDAQKDDGLPTFVSNYNSPQNVREIIGPDDLYSPSFDYHSSQVLLISRDRPAMYKTWRALII